MWDDIKAHALQSLCDEMKRGAGKVRTSVTGILVTIVVRLSGLPKPAIESIFDNLSDRAKAELTAQLDSVWHSCAEPEIIADCIRATCAQVQTMQSAGANVDGQALTALFLAAYNHASGLAVTPDKLTPALTVGITQVSLCVAAAGGGGAAPAASTSSGGGGLLWLAAAGLAAKVLLF